MPERTSYVCLSLKVCVRTGNWEYIVFKQVKSKRCSQEYGNGIYCRKTAIATGCEMHHPCARAVCSKNAFAGFLKPQNTMMSKSWIPYFFKENTSRLCVSIESCISSESRPFGIAVINDRNQSVLIFNTSSNPKFVAKFDLFFSTPHTTTVTVEYGEKIQRFKKWPFGPKNDHRFNSDSYLAVLLVPI